MYVNQARLSSTLQNPSLKKYDHVNIWMQEALSFVQDKFDLNPRFQRKGQREAYDQGSEASNKYCAFIYVFCLCDVHMPFDNQTMTGTYMMQYWMNRMLMLVVHACQISSMFSSQDFPFIKMRWHCMISLCDDALVCFAYRLCWADLDKNRSQTDSHYGFARLQSFSTKLKSEASWSTGGNVIWEV